MHLIAAFTFLLSFGSVFAQPSISTAGNYSPVIQNTGNGVVNVSIGQPEKARVQSAKDVASRVKEPFIDRAVTLLEKGRLLEAQQELKRFFTVEKDAIEKIAAGKYIEGQIDFINERYDLANESFGVALNLKPNDCSYIVSKSYASLNVGQYRDAVKLTSRTNQHTARCFSTGREVDRANLYLIQARLALESRDRTETLKAIDQAYNQIKFAKSRVNNDSWIEPVCVLPEMVLLLPKADRARWSDANRECSKALSSKSKTSQSLLSDLSTFYSGSNQDDYALPLGRIIKQQWKDPGSLSAPGVDLISKRAIYGRFVSELGFRTLWKEGDINKVASLYNEAFVTFEPLLNSGRPSVVWDMMQLVIRINDFKNRISSSEHLPSAEQTREAIRSSTLMLYESGALTSCIALDQILTAAHGFLPEEERNRMQVKASECYENAAPHKTWSGVNGRLTILRQLHNQNPTVESLKKVTEAREMLFSFPGDKDLHSDQAEDLLSIAKAVFRSKDENNKEESIFYINRAVEEAIINLSSQRSERVIASAISVSTLPSATLNSAASQILESISLREQTDSKLNLCARQNSHSFMASSLLIYAIETNQKQLIEKAAIPWRSELNGKNLCDDSKTNLQLDEAVELRMIDYLVIDEIASGEATAKSEKACMKLPVCSAMIKHRIDPKSLTFSTRKSNS